MEKKKTRSDAEKKINALDGLGRLTVAEANDLYLRYNNPNMRRLSDEEYDALYAKMYNQQGKETPEDS